MAEVNLGKVMGSKILFIEKDPTPGIGLLDDWALDTKTGKTWQKLTSGWAYRGNLKDGSILSINGVSAGPGGSVNLTAADIGVAKVDTLWENASRKSEFPSQTIAVPNLSAYDFYVITWGMSTMDTVLNTTTAEKGYDTLSATVTAVGTYGANFHGRNVTWEGPNSLNFADCHEARLLYYESSAPGASVAIENRVMIPLSIMGVKLNEV